MAELVRSVPVGDLGAKNRVGSRQLWGVALFVWFGPRGFMDCYWKVKLMRGEEE